MPSLLVLSRPFGDAHLEALFSHQQLHRAAGDLLLLLSLLIPVQLVLVFSRLASSPDASLVLLTAASITALVLCVLLSSLCPSRFHHFCLPLCALWLCSLVLIPLPFPSGPSHALLPSLLVIFILYTFFPFPPLLLALASATISGAQLVTFAVAEPGGRKGHAEKVLAALLAHLWAHLVGLYSLANGRRIARSLFLNARHAVESEAELDAEGARMGQLLAGALPPHVVASVRSQLGDPEVPRVFVEHFANSSVLYALLYGLPSVLAQLPVADSARLLNELDARIARLAKLHGLLLVQSDAVLALSGVSKPRDDHAMAACRFAFDLLALIKSFCDATSAEVHLRVGIGSGLVSGGIVGARRWHWDVIGMAMDTAMALEGNCPAGSVLISDDTWRQLGGRLTGERVDRGAWRLCPPGDHHPAPSSPAVQALLFPQAPRRFSLMTIPQAVSRLLNHHPPSSIHPRPSPWASTKAVPPSASLPTPFSKRKSGPCGLRRPPRLLDPCHHSPSPASPLLLGRSQPLAPFSLRFADARLERLFHAQIDRWFIPGLALSVLFLALFGLFQALVMPRLLTTLATLALALGLMFLLLLALYVSYCESFCQFVTRTALGHSTAVLLVLALLSTCGIANTFSCPSSSSSSSSSTSSAVCLPVHFPTLSFALWMLHSAVFVRFPSALLLPVLLCSVSLLFIHLFLTHPPLYSSSSSSSSLLFSSSSSSSSLILRLDLILLLLCLAILLFLHSRRNEILLRLDFLAILRSMEHSQAVERAEFLNDQILHNALPAHIAFGFAARSDPFAHLCPSVGVLCARLGRPGDWVGEFGFDRLNRIVCDLDQRLAQLNEQHRLEKVRSAHATYTVACGILPELARNVHDTPCTIGEQLSALAEFAQEIEQMADAEGLDIAVGMDCGAALSMVVGWVEGPRYELIGQPGTRAKKLGDAASALGGACVLLSEDVYAALRPRSQFHFDERSALSVAPGLVAYSLLRHPPPPAPLAAVAAQKPPPPPPHRNSGADWAAPSSAVDNELPSLAASSPATRPAPADPGPTRPPAAPAFSPALPPADLSPLRPSSGTLLRLRHNPLADLPPMFSSVHSSLSSDLFSVDLLSVESDSELEWVTPEMIANRQYRPFAANSPSASSSHPHLPPFHNGSSPTHPLHHHPLPPPYKGQLARQYSDFSEVESQAEEGAEGGGGRYFWGPLTRKKRNPRAVLPTRKGVSRVPRSWRGSASSAFGSGMSLQHQNKEGGALDRLNSAARRVDRMLKELAGMDGAEGSTNSGGGLDPCGAFPLMAANGNGGQNGENGQMEREESEGGGGGGGAMMSEYDNDAEEEAEECGRWRWGGGGGGGTDSEEPGGGGGGRLERMRRMLMASGRRRQNNQRNGGVAGRERNGNEADISCCSSMASSQQSMAPSPHRRPLLKNLAPSMRWRQSVHSIGYDNEYEMASAPLSSCSSYATGMSVDGVAAADERGPPETAPQQQKPQVLAATSGPSVGEHAKFTPIDADESEKEEEDDEEQKEGMKVMKEEEGRKMRKEEEGRKDERMMVPEGRSLRSQVLQLSRIIRNNFGDFPLSRFSDSDAADGPAEGGGEERTML